MGIFFTITLVVSIVGMSTLLVLKRYEENSGRVLLGAARPAVGNFFHRTLSWFEYVLPGLVRVGVRSVYSASRRLLQRLAVQGMARVEQWLEQALKRVRQTTRPRARTGETSSFLRQVTAHKKKLQEDNPDRATVVEE